MANETTTLEQPAEFTAVHAADEHAPLNMHPKAVAAREKAAGDKAEQERIQERDKQLIEDAVVAHNLQFLDITPNPKLCTPGMTVAFSPMESGSTVYRVSTALRNPKDPYDRHAGRLTALRAFKQGREIYVNIPKGIAPKAYLRNMFAW